MGIFTANFSGFARPGAVNHPLIVLSTERSLASHNIRTSCQVLETIQYFRSFGSNHLSLTTRLLSILPRSGERAFIFWLLVQILSLIRCLTKPSLTLLRFSWKSLSPCTLIHLLYASSLSWKIIPSS